MGQLRTRARAILTFLADLGGALTFVALAAGLIAAAVSGAVLAAWTAFPQPYFTLLVAGVAFLAVGVGPPLPPRTVVVAASESSRCARKSEPLLGCCRTTTSAR